MLDLTGVGSLPFKDAAGAMAHIYKYYFNCPFWNQSSGSAFASDMICQFLPAGNFKIAPQNGRLDAAFNDASFAEAIESELDEGINGRRVPLGIETLQKQADSLASWDEEIRFFKIQATGPVTMLNLLDANGKKLIQFKRLSELAIDLLFLSVRRLAREAEKINAPLWVQIDEPRLPRWNNNKEAYDTLGLFMRKLKALLPKAQIGVHSCANDSPSNLLKLRDADFLSFPLVNLPSSRDSTDALLEYLTDKGKVILGVVDLTLATGEPDEIALKTAAELLKELKFDLGSNFRALSRVLLSANCGMARLSPAQAELAADELVSFKDSLSRMVEG